MNFERFVIELIKIAGWELRYSSTNQPYAALIEGFGNGERGVKLHFTRSGGRVKVTGAVDYAEKIGIRVPFIHISLSAHPAQGADLIKRKLMPRYQETWEQAAPKIEAWLKQNVGY